MAGCAAAAANKGKCQDGAIGAAVGEIVGEHLLNGRNPDTLPLKEREQIIAYSRLVAGTAAGLAGGDVNVAADAAKVTVENNTFAARRATTTRYEYNLAAKNLQIAQIREIIPGFNGINKASIPGQTTVTSAEIHELIAFNNFLRTQPRGRSEAEYLHNFRQRASVPVAVSYALSPPSHHAQPNITYGSLDVFGRSTGVSAIINASTLRTGSWANPNIRPQGFLGGINNHARSHLLARILGGNGSDARNLTTLYQRNANHPNMSSFENTIVKRVESGETIRLRVIPIYKSFYPAPTGITLEARGSNGFKMNVSVPNQDSTLNLFGK